jgi:hypothetical protein
MSDISSSVLLLYVKHVFCLTKWVMFGKKMVVLVNHTLQKKLNWDFSYF